MSQIKTNIIGGDLTGGGGEKWIRKFYEYNKNFINLDIILFGVIQELLYEEKYIYPSNKNFKQRAFSTLYSFIKYVFKSKNQNWLLASGVFNLLTISLIKFLGKPNKIIVRETNLPLYYKKHLRHFYRILNLADIVVAQSLDMKKQLIRVGVHNNKIIIINNPVDNKISVISKKEISDRPSMAFIGRFTFQKGVDRIILAIKEKRLTLFSKLFFYGKGDLEIPNLKRVYNQGWKSKINFDSFDILLFPSRWEGMPNIIIEAIMHGKPIIANKWEGGYDELKEFPNIYILKGNWEENIDPIVERIIKDYNNINFELILNNLENKFNQKDIYNKWQQLLKA